MECARCSRSEIQRRKSGGSIPIGSARPLRSGRELVLQFAISNVGAPTGRKNVYFDRIHSPFTAFVFISFAICRTDQVVFGLTAAIVSIELTVTAEGITLNSFQGGVSSMVQNCVGIPMAFGDLCRILKRAGINLFPDDDAFCYCEGNLGPFHMWCSSGLNFLFFVDSRL